MSLSLNRRPGKKIASQRQYRVTVLTVTKDRNQKHNPEVLRSMQISEYRNQTVVIHKSRVKKNTVIHKIRVKKQTVVIHKSRVQKQDSSHTQKQSLKTRQNSQTRQIQIKNSNKKSKILKTPRFCSVTHSNSDKMNNLKLQIITWNFVFTLNQDPYMEDSKLWQRLRPWREGLLPPEWVTCSLQGSSSFPCLSLLKLIYSAAGLRPMCVCKNTGR